MRPTKGKVRSLKPWVLFCFCVIAAGMAIADSTPLPTVSHVDLARYVGKWYEIARYPTRFEKDCASDVTATYSLLSDGKIEVLNACREADGKMKTSKGKATVIDTETNSKLKVTFFWPFYGKYWIIDLAPDYSYAVVGEPGRDYLWILSRTPQMKAETYERILKRVKELGYEPAKLIHTKQTEGKS